MAQQLYPLGHTRMNQNLHPHSNLYRSTDSTLFLTSVCMCVFMCHYACMHVPHGYMLIGRQPQCQYFLPTLSETGTFCGFSTAYIRLADSQASVDSHLCLPFPCRNAGIPAVHYQVYLYLGSRVLNAILLFAWEMLSSLSSSSQSKLNWQSLGSS